MQRQRLLGEPAEQAGVAVEEPDDESVAAERLGGADEQLGARGAGQLLAVLAVAGVDERDVGAGEPGDQLVAVQLVDEDGVGGREPVAGSQRDESGIAGAGPDEGDAADWLAGASGGSGGHETCSVWCWWLVVNVESGRGMPSGSSAGPAGPASGAGRARSGEVGGAVLEQQGGEPTAGRDRVGHRRDDGAAQFDRPVRGSDERAERQLEARPRPRRPRRARRPARCTRPRGRPAARVRRSTHTRVSASSSAATAARRRRGPHGTRPRGRPARGRAASGSGR